MQKQRSVIYDSDVLYVKHYKVYFQWLNVYMRKQTQLCSIYRMLFNEMLQNIKNINFNLKALSHGCVFYY